MCSARKGRQRGAPPNVRKVDTMSRSINTVLSINVRTATLDSAAREWGKVSEARAKFAVAMYNAIRNTDGADSLSYRDHVASMESRGVHLSIGQLSNLVNAGEIMSRCGSALTVPFAVDVILPLPDLINASKRKAAGIGPDSDPVLTGDDLINALGAIDIAKLRAEKKARLSTSNQGAQASGEDAEKSGEDAPKRPASITDKLSAIVTSLTQVTRELDAADSGALISDHKQLISVIASLATEALNASERRALATDAEAAAKSAEAAAMADAAADGIESLDADAAETVAPKPRAARKSRAKVPA